MIRLHTIEPHSMPRQRTKAQQRKAADYVIISQQSLQYKKQLLDVFICSRRIETIHTHVGNLHSKDTPFNRLIQPHARKLLRGIVLSPEDLTQKTLSDTYLAAVPQDILNCIKYYLFVPFLITNLMYISKGISYCGIVTGVEKLIPRRDTLAGAVNTDVESYTELVRVDGTIRSSIEYIANVMREKKVYDIKGVMTHVYMYCSNNACARLTIATRNPFLLTEYHPNGVMISTPYQLGHPLGAEKRYLHGQLISIRMRGDHDELKCMYRSP